MFQMVILVEFVNVFFFLSLFVENWWNLVWTGSAEFHVPVCSVVPELQIYLWTLYIYFFLQKCK